MTQHCLCRLSDTHTQTYLHVCTTKTMTTAIAAKVLFAPLRSRQCYKCIRTSLINPLTQSAINVFRYHKHWNTGFTNVRLNNNNNNNSQSQFYTTDPPHYIVTSQRSRWSHDRYSWLISWHWTLHATAAADNMNCKQHHQVSKRTKATTSSNNQTENNLTITTHWKIQKIEFCWEFVNIVVSVITLLSDKLY